VPNNQTELLEPKKKANTDSTVSYFVEGKYVHRVLSVGEEVYNERVQSHYTDRNDRENFFISSLNSRLEPLTEQNKRLTYIDLFCGGGGLSLGVHNASKFLGMKPQSVLAADIDHDALNLVKSHFRPVYTRSKSVEDLIRYEIDLSQNSCKYISYPEIIDHQIKTLRGRVDLLVGGPPCQGHSNLNNKTRRYDPRNLLYLNMPSFAIALDIPNIIIENVQTISKAKENVVEITRNLLSAHGYFVEEHVLKASDFGVAQSRTRHFLTASKNKYVRTASLIRAFSGEEISFNTACTNMPKLDKKLTCIEQTSELSQENLDRINYLHDNNEDDLPNFVRPDCHKNGTTYRAVYGRIIGDLPMTTITTGFSSPGRGRFVHPKERRPISAREAARCQAFPDWYWEKAVELGLTRSRYQKVIGDAVPPLFAYPLMAYLFT
jgi:DNA (cytosine-5)-methyltransferase 1